MQDDSKVICLYESVQEKLKRIGWSFKPLASAVTPFAALPISRCFHVVDQVGNSVVSSVSLEYIDAVIAGVNIAQRRWVQPNGELSPHTGRYAFTGNETTLTPLYERDVKCVIEFDRVKNASNDLTTAEAQG